MIFSSYKSRPIKFLELYHHIDWKIKIYSISVKNDVVDQSFIKLAKQNLTLWLSKKEIYNLDTYGVATLILHEGKEGCFAIISWWIDQNMVQLFVYLATYEKPSEFVLYSDNGIITCTWEMAVLWHERNAWVKHVLMQHDEPDMEGYLSDCLNQII